MASPAVGIQIIIFGKRNETDLGGVLADCARAGYYGIELLNHAKTHPVSELRDWATQHKIAYTGLHVGFGDYVDDKKLEENIQFVRDIGGKYLMCSGVADPKTARGYEQSATMFNRVGAKIKSAGLVFCYHNHAWEFDDLGGGVQGMKILSEQTDSAVVKFNIDIFWVAVGKMDPIAFIRQHAKRAGYYHFKDGRLPSVPGGPAEFTELGKGIVNLKGCLQTAIELGGRDRAPWIISEQDRTDGDAYTSIKISRDYLKSIGV